MPRMRLRSAEFLHDRADLAVVTSTALIRRLAESRYPEAFPMK
jgi:hypothetical protein